MGVRIWSIVGAVAGVLAIAVAVFVFVFERTTNSKNLTIELLSLSRLGTETVMSSGRDIELLVDGRVVPDIAVAHLLMSNTGGQPIRSGDFEEDLVIHFGNAQEILNVEETGSEPEQLDVQLSIQGTTVTFPGVLLNPRDWVELRVIFVPSEDDSGPVVLSGRVVGVKEIELRERVGKDEGRQATSDYILIVQSLFAVLMAGSIFFLQYRRRSSARR